MTTQSILFCILSASKEMCADKLQIVFSWMFTYYNDVLSAISGNKTQMATQALSFSSFVEESAGLHINIFYYGCLSLELITNHICMILAEFTTTNEFKNNAMVAITFSTPDIKNLDRSLFERLFDGFCQKQDWEFVHLTDFTNI